MGPGIGHQEWVPAYVLVWGAALDGFRLTVVALPGAESGNVEETRVLWIRGPADFVVS
jgi:hypothetical protein